MEQLLQRRHDHVDVEGHPQAQQQPGQRANHADHRPLHHEYAHDAARAGTQCAQNRDVGAFVGHRHHQGADQVERSHGNNQREDNGHHGFFHLHGREPGAVLPRPVADQDFPGQGLGQLRGHRTRLVQVAQF